MAGFERFVDEDRVRTPHDLVVEGIANALVEAGYAVVPSIPSPVGSFRRRLFVRYPDGTIDPACVVVDRRPGEGEADKFDIQFEGNGHRQGVVTARVGASQIAGYAASTVRKMQTSDPDHPRRDLSEAAKFLTRGISNSIRGSGAFFEFEPSVDGKGGEYVVHNTAICHGEPIVLRAQVEDGVGYDLRILSTKGNYRTTSAASTVAALTEAIGRVAIRLGSGIDASMRIVESYEPAGLDDVPEASFALTSDVADTLATALLTDMQTAAESYVGVLPRNASDALDRIDELVAAATFVADHTSESTASVLQFEIDGLMGQRRTIENGLRPSSPSP